MAGVGQKLNQERKLDVNPMRESMRSVMRELSKIPCAGPFHPEPTRGAHMNMCNVRYATSADPASKKYNLTGEDLATMQAALMCHDIGCVHTTSYNESKKAYTAYGHEKVSVEMMQLHRDAIEEFGADFKRAEWLVANHMKYLLVFENGVVVLRI